MNKTTDIQLQVKILRDAPEALVQLRELRNKYYTNRDIKTWSAFFLLKSLTTSSCIQQWTKQRSHLESVLQCNENTLRRLLKQMEQLGLCQIDQLTKNVNLTSYEKAADILKISHNGYITINYNPSTHQGKQIFQYIIRCQEIQQTKDNQLEGLIYHINKNPLLRESLLTEVERWFNVDRTTLTDQQFQQYLYKMQTMSFKEGSATYDVIHHRRADINRGTRRIAKDHNYKGLSSVSYMKKVMKKHGLIKVKKNVVESNKRCRVTFLTCSRTVNEAQCKWKPVTKTTLMIFCDDIIPVILNNQQPKSINRSKNEKRKAA